RERELLDPIQTKVNSVIEGVRAAGNYAIIFDVSAPNNGIVTADKSLDLTQRVIQQLKAGS
ncbi:MAG TPA: OmpH family outer membrane protein, partial [Gemmatimonadales bacterium]